VSWLIPHSLYFSPALAGLFFEERRRSVNNNTKPKQNRTTETLGELDECLKETPLKEAGEIMLDRLYDKMAREGGPIPRA
jgi:hypothetical protein